MRCKPKPRESAVLPRIWEYLVAQHGAPFTRADIANGTGILRRRESATAPARMRSDGITYMSMLIRRGIIEVVDRGPIPTWRADPARLETPTPEMQALRQEDVVGLPQTGQSYRIYYRSIQIAGPLRDPVIHPAMYGVSPAHAEQRAKELMPGLVGKLMAVPYGQEPAERRRELAK